MSKEAEQMFDDIKAAHKLADKIFDVTDEVPMHLVIPALVMVLAAIGIQLLRDDDYSKAEYLEDIYDSLRDAYEHGAEALEDDQTH